MDLAEVTAPGVLKSPLLHLMFLLLQLPSNLLLHHQLHVLHQHKAHQKVREVLTSTVLKESGAAAWETTHCQAASTGTWTTN